MERICPLCGQPVPQDITVYDEIALEDPRIADPLGEFVRFLGLSRPKQRELSRYLSAYSTRAVLYGLKIVEQRGVLKNTEIQNKLAYFKAVVKRRHEELQHEVESCGRPSLEYDPTEWES